MSEQELAEVGEGWRAERIQTRCSVCQHPFSIRPSMAMRCGMNTGHVGCPKCDEFLHVELLEGNEAWTEPFADYLARINLTQ